jgi:hypothetical protein
MKLFVLLAAVTRLIAASPQGSSVAATPPALAPATGKATTPAGCRKLASDADWPAEAEWKKVLPDVEPRSKKLAAGVYRPDYSIRAESYKDVQAAVKFATANNVRLTLITSGHDFPVCSRVSSDFLDNTLTCRLGPQRCSNRSEP